MRKLFIPISMGLLCTSFTVVPTVPGSNNHIAGQVYTKTDSSSTTTDAVQTIFCGINLEQYGLSQQAFEYAWKGYQQLLVKNKISRTAYLTICDFSQSSKRRRLYIIDVENNRLVTNTYVAHGKNSGGEYASSFSNTPESLQSSLGFYITQQTYTGEHGLSLRINGVDPGYNDNAFARSIVIHGAAYVDAARAKAGLYMGRSYGCPAVPQNESAKIITTIKNGSCLFIYHPSKNYLLRSRILNG